MATRPASDTSSHTATPPAHVDPSEKDLANRDGSATGNNNDNTSESPAEPASEEKKPSPPGGGHDDPPPNGGLNAWLHIVGGFMLFFNTWGILNAFGVFQTYYESGEFIKVSSSAISWIGSLQSFMVLFAGIITGPLYDRGYWRTLLFTGSFGVVFGHMMLSLCKEYWQVLLAQGIVVGAGAGCLFVPTVSILPTYFTTKLGLALGIAVSGSSIGGVIYPIVLYKLLDQVGFGWSVRIMGFIALATLAIPCAIMRMRVRPAKPREPLDPTAFRDFPYLLFVFATLIGFIGLACVLFYLSYYADAKGFTDGAMSFYILCVFNAGSFAGRLAPSAISDKVGPFNIIAPACTFFGMGMFLLLAVKNEGGIVVLALFTGFMSGVLISMPPLCFGKLTKDKSVLGTRIGMGYAIAAFGLLAGGPGAGGVLDGGKASLDWTGLWCLGGATATAAGMIYLGVRVWLVGPKPMIKV